MAKGQKLSFKMNWALPDVKRKHKNKVISQFVKNTCDFKCPTKTVRSFYNGERGGSVWSGRLRKRRKKKKKNRRETSHYSNARMEAVTDEHSLYHMVLISKRD